MPEARVMVVDSSAAMRAMFCDLLSNANGVEVCGVASSADEARKKIKALRPDVLALDVEMPGMSGIEFLAEVMARNPLPVIILSSKSPSQSGRVRRALELGAVHCLAKPSFSSCEEFQSFSSGLASIIINAARAELAPKETLDDHRIGSCYGTRRHQQGSVRYPGYHPDGSLVVLACGAAGLKTVCSIVSAYPRNCPPTVVIVDAPKQEMANWFQSIRHAAECSVTIAGDGTLLEPGCVGIAFDDAHHVVIDGGSPLRIRCTNRPPVDGARPSADLFMGSIVREGVDAVAGVLAGTGADGAKGLQILSHTGQAIFSQKPEHFEPRGRYDAVRALGLEVNVYAAGYIADWIIDMTAAEICETV